jgi:hypothetical protein
MSESSDDLTFLLQLYSYMLFHFSVSVCLSVCLSDSLFSEGADQSSIMLCKRHSDVSYHTSLSALIQCCQRCVSVIFYVITVCNTLG